MWLSWKLTQAQKENPKTVLKKYSDHLVGVPNKWVMRLEFSEMKQQENEPIDDFIVRIQSKAEQCSFSDAGKQDMVTFQLIKGIQWTEARRVLIGKGNDLAMDAAITCAKAHEATTQSTSSFDKKGVSVNALNKHHWKNECGFCGTKHARRKCPAYGTTCETCGRKNHFAKVCQSKTTSDASKERSKSQDRRG